MTRKLLLTAVLTASLFHAQAAGPRKLFRASLGVLAAGTAADAATSWGKGEASPWLRNAQGRFGARGLGIKAGIGAGTAFTTWLIHRRHPGADPALAVVNFTVGGSGLALAIHNSRVRRRP